MAVLQLDFHISVAVYKIDRAHLEYRVGLT